jgi:hypothetical protein
MQDPEPLALGARLWLAFVLPWRVLFDGVLAGRVERVVAGLPALEPAKPEPEPKAPPVLEAEPDETPALQLLALLQREGRFVDFLQEDVSGFSDAEIGAAARVVHEGCTRSLAEVLSVVAIRTEEEGADIVLEDGYDAARNRVTGNVVGSPPYRGKLAHHGWRVEKLALPRLTKGHDPRILAPAEIEL